MKTDKKIITLRDKFAKEMGIIAKKFQETALTYINAEGFSDGIPIFTAKCKTIMDKLKELCDCDLTVFSQTIEEEKQDEV